jgi:hypothetical protein
VEDHDGLDHRRHPELPAVVLGVGPVNWFGSTEGAVVSGADHRHPGATCRSSP